MKLTLQVTAAALILTFIMVFGSWAFGKECVNVNASWYGRETCKFNPDPRCPTASGILHFNGSQLIVAHRSWPFHTKVRITYHGKSVVAPVEDRGPAKWTGRSIDMSKAVARALGFKGTDVVCVERLSVGGGDRVSGKPGHRHILAFALSHQRRNREAGS